MKSFIKERVQESLNFEIIESLMDEDYPITWNIEEFKALRNFAQRIRYCQEHLQRISSGSSRIVYKIDNQKVLKLAKNRRGIAQNQVEIDVSRDYLLKHIVAEIFESDENSLWTEMELARKVNLSIFQKVVGISFENFSHALRYFEWSTKAAYRYSKPDNYDELWDNEFMSSIFDIVGSYDFPSADLCKLSTWGLVNRDGQDRIVMIDYGLTSDVYDSYYK
jgi:hypothetical protein